MKRLAFVALVASTIIPLTSAHGAVLTVGGPLSYRCYQSALAGDSRSLALDACNRALQEEALVGPDLAATYINRGILLMSAARYTAADKDFDTAIGLIPTMSDGWLNKGFLRLRQGHGRDALPLIQKGIDIGARNEALAIFARGVAHEQMGDFGPAYADLQRARELAPGWSLPREYLASYQVRR